MNQDLYHHGVKGMHWGVRRYQNADGSLTSAGKKKYAKEGFARDAFNRNKTKAGKARDLLTGAHKKQGNIEYGLSSEKERNERAYRHLAEKSATKEASKQAIKNARSSSADANKQIGKTAAKGAMAMIGTAAVGHLAMTRAYASGNDVVGDYIAKGLTLAEIGIFAGSVGKMVDTNVKTYKDLSNRR